MWGRLSSLPHLEFAITFYIRRTQITVDHLRRFAVARSLFTPTTLKSAFQRLGFVQADPIRAPARAQDLILRHRIKNYHDGDLERRYTKLGIEEDFFINYGFVTRSLQALMHQLGYVRPCRWPRTVACRTQQAGAAPAGVRTRARRGTPPRGRRPFLARHGDELLGRFVECHHASARRHALPRHAACGASRPWHSCLCCASARARTCRCSGARGADRRAG
jgi:Winged helix DNA-binding domain